MSHSFVELGNLPTIVAGPHASTTAIVLLHGHSMNPADLSPFADSLGFAGLFLFPQGPVAVEPAGRAWWPVDMAAKARMLAAGPRDLFDRVPDGLAAARERLESFLAAVMEQFQPKHLILGGFSQGAMLACDWYLNAANPQRVRALALMSASRLNFDTWPRHSIRLRELPVLTSHGRQDHDLAFQAGEALRDFLSEAGAQVTWIPFDGGHEIPLTVWRGLKRFAHSITV